MDTTRKYPRSLAEAFPDERYPVVEVFRREPLGHKVAEYLGAIILVVMVIAVVLGWV